MTATAPTRRSTFPSSIVGSPLSFDSRPTVETSQDKSKVKVSRKFLTYQYVTRHYVQCTSMVPYSAVCSVQYIHVSCLLFPRTVLPFCSFVINSSSSSFSSPFFCRKSFPQFGLPSYSSLSPFTVHRELNPSSIRISRAFIFCWKPSRRRFVASSPSISFNHDNGATGNAGCPLPQFRPFDGAKDTNQRLRDIKFHGRYLPSVSRGRRFVGCVARLLWNGYAYSQHRKLVCFPFPSFCRLP